MNPSNTDHWHAVRLHQWIVRDENQLCVAECGAREDDAKHIAEDHNDCIALRDKIAELERELADQREDVLTTLRAHGCEECGGAGVQQGRGQEDEEPCHYCNDLLELIARLTPFTPPARVVIVFAPAPTEGGIADDDICPF